MIKSIGFLALLSLASSAFAELRVPASTAYLDPDPNGAKVSKEGISGWTNPQITVTWFGEIKSAGMLDASVVLRLPQGANSRLRLTVDGQKKEAQASGKGQPVTVKFGTFNIAKAGYVKFQLTSLNPNDKPAGDLDALVLDGAAVQGAHFNLDPRRNAASVHLQYSTPPNAEVALFYNEVTAV
ncbi:MAG TPA: DUF5077 domain-containing protein, partial [Chthoniobacter sp.]|nr:DUF5077 domain-containing protein [Chthoniobacter sp.]